MFEEKIIEAQQEPAVEAPETVPSAEPEAQSQLAHAEAPEVTKVQEPESPKERNVRILRERSEREAREKNIILRERDEARARIRELEEARSAQKSASTEEDYSINIAADDLAEGKHLHKMASKVDRLQQEVNDYKKHSALMLAKANLKSECPDYDKVCSAENIAVLEELHPEIAGSIAAGKDAYLQAKAAYNIIKKFGIYVEDTFEKDRELVQKNAAKPKPLASVSPQQGDSPLSRANAFANGLTPELKEQLFKEMNEARKGY